VTFHSDLHSDVHSGEHRGHRRGLVIGCGGTLGFAWSAVVLAEVERQLGWDARSAAVLIGTSAGSELVASLGSGRTPTDVLDALNAEPNAGPDAGLAAGSDADLVLRRHLGVHPGAGPMLPHPTLPRPTLPALGLVRAGVRRRSAYSALAGLLPRGRGDATYLHEFGNALADPATGWSTHPATWCVAVDTRTGQRTAFGAPDAPPATLGQAVAASMAIPGWFPPVRIGDRAYLDGGIASTASLDLVIPLQLDEVIVIAPMTTRGGAPATGADRVERLLRKQMTAVLDREETAVQASGTRVIRIEPGPRELAVMGPNFMDLRRRADTLAIATDVVGDTVAASLAGPHVSDAGAVATAPERSTL
jgi:NTE family protein